MRYQTHTPYLQLHQLQGTMNINAQFMESCALWTLSTYHVLIWEANNRIWGATNPFVRENQYTICKNSHASLDIVVHVVSVGKNNIFYFVQCIKHTINQSITIFVILSIYHYAFILNFTCI